MWNKKCSVLIGYAMIAVSTQGCISDNQTDQDEVAVVENALSAPLAFKTGDTVNTSDGFVACNERDEITVGEDGPDGGTCYKRFEVDCSLVITYTQANTLGLKENGSQVCQCTLGKQELQWGDCTANKDPTSVIDHMISTM